MVRGGVLGEQGRRRERRVIRVIGVRRVDQAVRVPGREQGAGGRAPVQYGSGRRRHRHPRRQDEGGAEGGGRGAQGSRRQAGDGRREEALGLGGGGRHAPPLFVASCGWRQNGLTVRVVSLRSLLVPGLLFYTDYRFICFRTIQLFAGYIDSNRNWYC